MITRAQSVGVMGSGLKSLTGAVSDIATGFGVPSLVQNRKTRRQQGELARERLEEQKRQFDKQFGLDQFLSMIDARDKINRQEWQRKFRNALMGR